MAKYKTCHVHLIQKQTQTTIHLEFLFHIHVSLASSQLTARLGQAPGFEAPVTPTDPLSCTGHSQSLHLITETNQKHLPVRGKGGDKLQKKKYHRVEQIKETNIQI